MRGLVGSVGICRGCKLQPTEEYEKHASYDRIRNRHENCAKLCKHPEYDHETSREHDHGSTGHFGQSDHTCINRIHYIISYLL